MRVDVFAERYSVTVTDVLVACHLLNVDVSDSTSEFDEVAFSAAARELQHRREEAGVTEPVPIAPARRPHRVLLSMAAAAALVAVVLVGSQLGTRGGSGHVAEEPTLAAYTAELEAAYEATVGELPAPADFATLAKEWSALTPPENLRTEHAQLIAEAEAVAALAAATPGSTTPAPADPVAAADALGGHLEHLVAAVSTPAP